MLVTITYNGVGEISGATLSRSELLALVDGNNYFKNSEVWRTVTVSFRNNRSNQRLVINFRIDDHTQSEFEGEFILRPEVRGSEFLFDALYLYDLASGGIRITKKEITENLNLEFGFLLKESGAKIKLGEEDSIAYR